MGCRVDRRQLKKRTNPQPKGVDQCHCHTMQNASCYKVGLLDFGMQPITEEQKQLDSALSLQSPQSVGSAITNFRTYKNTKDETNQVPRAIKPH